MNNSTSYDYSGAKVLVTGGTSGIGYGIATAFVNAGAQVTVTGTRPSAAEYDDVDLSAFSYKVLKVQDTEAIKLLAAELDGLDILVNNAGASMPGGDEWTHEGFEESVRVNLFSAYHMSQACLEHLKASEIPGGASIIGVASLTSFFANELVPGYGVATGDESMVFRVGDDGHFRVRAVVDGVALDFLVDTGASDVALTRSDARRLGFDLDALAYIQPYTTANGVVYGAPVILGEMVVGPIRLTDVAASVNQAPMGGASLLGMSFLGRLGAYEVSNGSLTLRQ